VRNAIPKLGIGRKIRKLVYAQNEAIFIPDLGYNLSR
jgi:hypothetical protein